MEEIKKFLGEISPREYQIKIYENCKNQNCLVILPTGTGKTLIALMLSIYVLEKNKGKILFLAPTRPLAEQHLNYFKKHLQMLIQMEIFTGKVPAEKRKEIWQRADIIFSTPQCIVNDLKKNLYNLNEVSLLIEDECHRCLKNYAYTDVAKKYKENPKNHILGLTASPGSDRTIIKKVADNLGINAIEIRTRDSEDVKEYLQELEFEAIKLDFPEEFDKIRQMLKKIYNKKVDELKSRKLLFLPATKKNLLDTQHRIMRAISSGNKHFNLLVGASVCATAIKLQHALELLETQTLSSFHTYLQDLFDQANKGKSKAAVQLVKQPEFNASYIAVTELLAKKIEHPKIGKIKEIVEEEIKKSEKAKILIFSQYRESVVKICKEVNGIQNIRARVFVGQAKKTSKGEETGLSQKEQQEIIKEFSLGKINVLCATSIGEEGLDIPEVNAVVFYEPVPSAIRKIQRAGRTARLMDGKLIILITKNTRDEAYYWVAFHKEKKMYQAIEGIKKDMKNNAVEGKQKTLF
ncbi:hypothetical protein COV15_02755 [Candidatus Woesearchaeota archaeon CG10_big_fil_rev_8_21_14_0_10_34_12]|nr:MAG: hypothetical protein COV15_02755 [Candidatus Woesearchaeota archaeon CG10_big_fil_rev_8_21_14_0_10_34_12]